MRKSQRPQFQTYNWMYNTFVQTEWVILISVQYRNRLFFFSDTEHLMRLSVWLDGDDLSLLNYTPSASAGSLHRKVITPHITNMWLSPKWAFRNYDKGAGAGSNTRKIIVWFLSRSRSGPGSQYTVIYSTYSIYLAWKTFSLCVHGKEMSFTHPYVEFVLLNEYTLKLDKLI